MAAHGKVVSLLQERNLHLQDITDNIAPLPSLVAYKDYAQTAILYTMDTEHEFFMALIQDYTARMARREDRELWTWWVQVEANPFPTCDRATKKLRVGPGKSAATTSFTPLPQPAAQIQCIRRLLRPQLFHEEDIIRVLINIIQVESRLVPNYIEFLYQLIDYYEGDGKALQAALRLEIPSLWSFEDHPLPLCDRKGRTRLSEGDELKELRTELTKVKPDLNNLEKLTNESERLQYREPRFGLQPPIDEKDEPLPALINVPRDLQKRKRYYAACFKCRYRAMVILHETGFPVKAVADYQRLQGEDPRSTSGDGKGNGFANYLKDAPFAKHIYLNKRIAIKSRERQMEVTLSDRLAQEAQQDASIQSIAATQQTLYQQDIPPVTIPNRPGVGVDNESFKTVMERAEVSQQAFDPPIMKVPGPLRNRLSSRLFSVQGRRGTGKSRMHHNAFTWNDRDLTSVDGPATGDQMMKEYKVYWDRQLELAHEQISVPSPSLPRPAQALMQTSNRAVPPAPLNLQVSRLNFNGSSQNMHNPNSPSQSMTPLAGLAMNLSLATPRSRPIYIYMPSIVKSEVHRGDIIWHRIHGITDCLILGHLFPHNQSITLTKAIFMPTDIFNNTLNRVRQGNFAVLEAYAALPNHPLLAARHGVYPIDSDIKPGPHRILYDKISQIHSLMVGIQPQEREQLLTKRWRVTPASILETHRGAIWEGWGMWTDKAFEMSREDRRGALQPVRGAQCGGRQEDVMDVSGQRTGMGNQQAGPSRRLEIADLLELESIYHSPEDQPAWHDTGSGSPS